MTTLPTLPPETFTGLAGDVASLLARLDVDIAARKPRCDASGRCCKFEEYGHRLYVTLAELVHFAHVLAPSDLQTTPVVFSDTRISLPQFFASAQPLGCPYQKGQLCCARDARPLGCRIYFCDHDAQSWQNTLYERYHEQLKALHLRWHVEYLYMEWRSALAMAHEAGWLPAS